MRIDRETTVNAGIVAVLALAPLVGWLMGEPFVVTLATKAVILAIAAVGLNMALGLGGLVSFGHAAYFGLGGYAAGVLAIHAFNSEPIVTWPLAVAGTTSMLVIWPVAIAVGGLAAAAIGALTLRTSGVYFIMITLAFAQMLFYFAISWPTYGGEDGLSFYVRNRMPLVDTLDPMTYFLVTAAVLAVCVALHGMLARSRFGLALRGVRQNERRVTSFGIRPFGVRLSALVISGMVTAWAGALYADLNRFVSPSMLSWQTSGEIMVLVILGGVGRTFGPVAGAVLFVVLEHVLGGLTEHWQVPLGVLLLAVVLWAPGGLVGVLSGAGGDRRE